MWSALTTTLGGENIGGGSFVDESCPWGLARL